MPELVAFWTHMENWLTANALVPTLVSAHLGGLVQYPHEIVRFLMINVVQIAVIGLIFRPFETLAPAEQWENRNLTRVDIFYTLIKGLGLVPLMSFIILAPLVHFLGGFAGPPDASETPRLAEWLPWLGDHPVVLFLVYFVLLDLIGYVVHRLQHVLPWWWAMHSLHHSQRQLSCWSNDRSHILDDSIEAVIAALMGLAIGVPPDQFALLILFGTLIENLSHANTRLRFGPVLDKVLIDPRFHRTHHILASADQPHLHDCNYGLVLPIWDMLFGTARYDLVAEKTGVLDAGIDADNSKFWLGQQIAGFRRFFGVLRSGKATRG